MRSNEFRGDSLWVSILSLPFSLPPAVRIGMNDKKNILEVLDLAEGRNLLTRHTFRCLKTEKYCLMFSRSQIFCEYRICLSDFVITRENFHQKERQLLQLADICFSRIDRLLFATGIYELTYYFTNSITEIESFDKGILTKFPFIFFRNRNKYDLVPTDRYNNTICVLNTGGDV